ncbi:hypothetical protein FVEN_g169 [Fusarium venenatum]|uniref:uncharacterized protein n=1 Tax=Fusarium venenatum TaxID=56646 RepID=UPI001DA39EA2|nr:hypothetical protein FVEN_g169 [Fusarium venenatum]KAH6994629.1 hypothetical protein EDB82DRAFT_556905 [Fusarium venenatum]
MSERKDLGNVTSQMTPSASTSAEAPPSYDVAQPRSYDQTHAPSYDTAQSQSLQDGTSDPEDLPTLVLNSTKIYSLYAPNHILYQLSKPPYDGGHYNIYGVEKVRYRLVEACRNSQTSNDIAVVGQTSRKRTYRDIMIQDRTTGSGIRVEATGGNPERLLEAESPLKDRLNRGKTNTVVWKDDKGQVVAIETKLQRNKDNIIEEPPRLAIKVRVDEKLYDLLITCWCAQVWKSAQKDLKEPMSWDKVKRIASAVPNKTSAIYGGGKGGFIF